MPLDPFSLAIGGATALPKIILGAKQLSDASRVKFQDTTTPEQRELLAMARQRAAFGRLPGVELAKMRLAQSQNNTLQNAALGAGSASDLLAAGAAADRTRQNGELQLTAQSDQYNERAQAGLGVALQQQAQQRQRDLQTYNQRKANLTQGGLENLGNAVDQGAAYAAYGANKAAEPSVADLGLAQPVDALTPRTIGLGAPAVMAPVATAPGIRGTTLPGYRPSINGGRYRTSASRYGLSY
jgi:hypothetical protein